MGLHVFILILAVNKMCNSEGGISLFNGPERVDVQGYNNSFCDEQYFQPCKRYKKN